MQALLGLCPASVLARSRASYVSKEKNGIPLAGLLVAQRDASEIITTMMLDEAQVKVSYYFSLDKADLDHCTAR